MTNPRLLLVDDHKLLRQGLRRAVEEAGFDVVGEAGDGEEAVRLAVELRPDLVLMDVTMPVLDGIEATRRLRQSAPEARVVILTIAEDDESVEQAFESHTPQAPVEEPDPDPAEHPPVDEPEHPRPPNPQRRKSAPRKRRR